MNNVGKDLLLAVADLHQVPSGAYSIRENGNSVDISSTTNINIVPKKDKKGIDIYIKDNTVNESMHIPVIITQTGIKELVYNDFHIGDNCDVLIVAGCGIHNPSEGESEHSGVHTFHIGKNSKVSDSIIMNNVVIGDNVIINNAVIGDDAIISNDVRINTRGLETPEYVNTKICSNDLSLIGCNVTLGKGVKVGKLSMITKNIKGGK